MVVVQMDWGQEVRTHLSGALLVYVQCVHLCCKSVMDSGDMQGLVAENQGWKYYECTDFDSVAWQENKLLCKFDKVNCEKWAAQGRMGDSMVKSTSHQNLQSHKSYVCVICIVCWHYSFHIPPQTPRTPHILPCLKLGQATNGPHPGKTITPKPHQSKDEVEAEHAAKCKGTSIHSLTFPLLPYSPLVHMYFSHTFVPSLGTTPKADNFCIQSPTTFQMSTHQKSLTFRLLFRSYLSSIGQASDALGHVHMTLRHPPLSRGWLSMGGLVLGGLAL
jgi:hypothetical protein